MSLPVGDIGESQYEHLQAAADGLIPDLEAEARLASIPPLPALGGHMWAIFQELHSRRAYGEFGPVRLSWVELEAYSRVARQKLSAHTLQTIFALEDEYFAVLAENKK